MPAYRPSYRKRIPQWPHKAAGFAVGRVQRVGAAGICDVLDAYGKQIDDGFNSLNQDFVKAGALDSGGAGDNFNLLWQGTLNDWGKWYQDYSCNWLDQLSLSGSQIFGAAESLRNELDAWNESLRGWQARGEARKNVTPTQPPPQLAPALPESATDSVSSTIKTVAIAVAVVVGGIAVWKVVDLVQD